ncbi:MAG: TonB-dependent receptor plug domain-containing protein [Bacteroidota bacterium]
MRTFYHTVLGLCALMTASVTAADNEGAKDTMSTHRLSEVVITATKTATPLAEIGSTVTVISGRDIEKTNKSFVSEVLRDIPGVNIVQQGGAGRLSRVFVRGANPHHTLILVDGVEMSDPSSISNAYDISTLQTDNIDRIEVLRGPQSTLYGSDALAGVISIFTRKGEAKPAVHLNAEGGSFGTYKGSAGVSGRTGMFNYSLGYARLQSDGFSTTPEKYGNKEKDSYLNNSLRTKLGLDITEDLAIDFTGGYAKTKTDMDQNAKNGDDPNFEGNFEEITLKSSVDLSLFDKFWQQNLSVAFYKNINQAIDEPDEMRPTVSSDAYFAGRKLKFEWQHSFRIMEGNTLTAGIESENEYATTSYKATGDWPSDNYFPSHRAVTTGIYLQDQISLFNSLFGSFGVRYDNHDRFGDVVTYRIAPAFLIKQTATKLKFTAGSGFKSPSLYYLFDPMFGNKDLKAEKSSGIDAGIEQYLFDYKLTIGASYFFNSFTDLIGYEPVTYKTVNIDKAETRGVELSLSTAPVRNVSLKFNYTYTDARDKSNGGSKLLIRRPMNKISALVNYEYGNAGVSFEVINTGKRQDDDFTTYTRVDMKPYTLMNLAASYKLNRYVELSARIENMLDEEYEEVLYYATAGRSVYAGIKLSY